MLDIRLIREQPDVVRRSLALRGAEDELDAVIAADVRRRELIVEVEALRAERNTASRAIGEAKQRGEDAAAEKEAMRQLGARLAAYEAELAGIEVSLDELLAQIPNLVADDVPEGGEDDAVVVRTHGERPAFDFKPRDHLDIATALGLVDMERGARTSGSRFAYLLGDAVRLQFALVQFAIDRLGEAGFVPVVPPVLVREQAMWGTGFFPADANQIYRIPEEHHDLFLVGTSEVSLASLHAGEILDESALPLRYAGISPCFRREAGSAGKDTRGIFRVHQFDKVEMFSFVAPEQSPAEHEFILAQEEAIVRALDLHYQVVNIAAGDLGASATKKYDIEVWLPGQGRYRELTSTSNTTDYQARRLKVRVKRDGRSEPVHTLNGTAIAIGRMLIALLETHQREDGGVDVPEVLRRYGAPASIEPARPVAVG